MKPRTGHGVGNLLQQPLFVEQEVEFGEPYLSPGSWYLTVVRDQIKAGGLVVAMTTARPLSLVAGRYRLWVFEQSFRLWEAVGLDGGPPPDGPPRDALGLEVTTGRGDFAAETRGGDSHLVQASDGGGEAARHPDATLE